MSEIESERSSPYQPYKKVSEKEQDMEGEANKKVSVIDCKCIFRQIIKERKRQRGRREI